jgi:hypothetical protein
MITRHMRIQIMDKDQLIAMNFPIDKDAGRNVIIKALLDRKADIKNAFKNNEYLGLDFKNQELIGIKSTSSIGNIKVGDLPAFLYAIGSSEKYNHSDIARLGNVDMIYEHFSKEEN